MRIYFGEPSKSAGGTMLATDMDGDGLDDLVVSPMTVLLGSRTGELSREVESPGPAFATSMTAGDVNGDGFRDIVASTQRPGTIDVYLGDGSGALTPAPSLTLAYPFVDQVGLIHLDSDGILDLIANAQNELRVYLGQGGGSFQLSQTRSFSGVDGFVCADFNGDGAGDVAFCYSAFVRLLLGNGDGTLRSTEPVRLGEYVNDLDVGDFDEDGRPELVAVSYGHERTWVLEASFGGLLEVASEFAMNGPSQCTVGDFDGDGAADIAVQDVVDTLLRILQSNGRGEFKERAPFPLGGYGTLVAADLNGDGRTDIVTGDDNGVRVAIGTPKLVGEPAARREYEGLLGPHVIPWSGARLLDSGDLDGDGDPDLVIWRWGAFSTFLNHPYGPFEFVMTTPTVGEFGALADLDGDGTLDIATGARWADELELFRGQSDGTFVPMGTVDLAASSWGIEVADLDGNGTQDLLVTINTSPVSVQTYLGDGGGAFAPLQTFPSMKSAAVADFDGDGVLDAVFTWRGTLELRLGTGTGAFGPAVTFSPGGFASLDEVVTGDLNGDGSVDVIAKSQTQLWSALGTGTGGLGPLTAVPIGSRLEQLRIGDFDADGKLDALALSEELLAFAKGRGDGTFETPRTYATEHEQGGYGSSEFGLTTADFNGDSVPDAAVTGHRDDVWVLYSGSVR